MSAGRRRDLVLACAVGGAMLAALVTMSEVFADAGWIRPTVLSVVASLTLAVVVRAASLPASVALAVDLAAFVVVASALHLPEAPLVPGLDELRALRDLAADGALSIRDQAAPAESLPGLVLLVSSGAWFVTFSAHELAVRLRGAGVALVPIAALWVVPLAMPQAVPPGIGVAVPFLVAAAVVLLLESDTDLVGWAREHVRPRVTLSGATIAAGAITLGLVAPWLLPGLGEPALLDVGTGRDPRGYQPFIDVGDRLSLPIERPVLRVRTDRRVYLRLAALDTYDDDTWRIGPPGEDTFTPSEAELFSTRDPLPFETPIATAEQATVDVEVLDLENIYVPTPYQPVNVSGPGAGEMVWSRVGGFLATGELSENELGGTLRTGVVPGFEYTVTAAVPDPSIEDLRAAEPSGPAVRDYLQLPGDPERWRPYGQLAEEVFADAGARSTVDRVLALQRWFTDEGGFDYSLTDIDPLRGSSALENFLFGTRTGYCEYFSTAMAVMLRAAGIPARTAIGFLPGDRIESGDPDAEDPRATYQVTTGDAHAWVEVLFPGEGWITFDPTPRSDGSTLPPDAEDLSPELPVAERTEQEEQPSAGPSAAPSAAPSFRDGPSLNDGTATSPETAAGGAGGSDDGFPLWPLVVAAALLAGGVVWAVRRAGLDDDGAHAALVAQRRVLRTGAQHGAPRHPSETATEVLHRWASEDRIDPSAAAELAAIARRAAFSRSGAEVDGARARVLADRLVDELRGSFGTASRLLAPVRVPAARGAAELRRLVDAGRERLTP